MYTNKCIICSTEFKTYRPKQKTCSRTCMGKSVTGENNPNYNNAWTDEKRKKQSEKKKQDYKDNHLLAQECGKSNRGKKFDKDLIEKMHGHRTPESYSHPHTESAKEIIGKKSSAKWTESFKLSFRKLMEDNGHWVRLEDKEPYDLYYCESNWKESMINHLNEDLINVVNERGLFSSKNTKGWVRDHIVSRMVGYEFGIPSYIMRHPANLQLISHAENVSKGFSDRKLTESQKRVIIEELFNRILSYTKSWNEQEMCVKYIKELR